MNARPGSGLVDRDSRRGLLLAGLVALLALLLPPPQAAAHAALVESDPEAGSEIAESPDVVELRFSEPIIAEMSTVTVTDPDGREWTPTVKRDDAIRVDVDTDTDGIYTVAWKTVSPLDGHTLRGRFSFGVGVDPGEQPAASTAPGTGALIVAGSRVVEYLGLLAGIGMLLLARLARQQPSLKWMSPRVRWPLGAALGGGIAVVVGEALLAAASPSAGAILSFLAEEPGTPRMVRLATEAIALAAAVAGVGWVAAAGVASAMIALAASGHAAGAGAGGFSVAVQSIHLIAAGLWAGAILAMATLRPPDGWRGEGGVELLRRFSPVAIIAFVVTVATGSLRGADELRAVSDLWRDPYGRTLGLKVIAVALMVPLSVRAWRRRSPRPRMEAALAVVAVGAAAVLAAFPLPPQRAGGAATGSDDEDPSLPQAGDVTIGLEVGTVLVGVTVRSADSPDDIFVHLQTTSGEEVAGTQVALAIDGEPVTLDVCGPSCRWAHVHIEPGQQVEVGIDGVEDTETFEVPSLPPPDGRQLLELLDGRMGELRTVRYDEAFRPLDPPLLSTVSMKAPDRLHAIQHTTGNETIRIGDVLYRRSAPDEPWKENRAPDLEVPSYIWEEPDRVAPTIWGTQTVDGVETEVLTFFVDHRTTPIWYRLWVDEEGLVHQAEMRARGHFMDHRYYDFDAPMTIEAPPEDEIEPPEE